MSKQPIRRWLPLGIGFGICGTLVLLAGGTGQNWIILLALIAVPIWGWLCKRRGWL